MANATPVLICGAGPTGMALALELARFGIAFRIIDRNAGGARFSQALAIQARTLELLEAPGITDALLERSQRVAQLRLKTNGRVLAEIDFSGLPSAYPFVAVVPQVDTENVMRAQLAELGVTIERATELRAYTALDQEGAEVVVAGPRGTETLRATYVAACDGAHSTLRHLLELPFAGFALPERFALADLKLDTALDANTVHVTLAADGGAVALIPMPAGWRMIVESPLPFPEPPTLSALQSALDATAIPAHIQTLGWAANYNVHQRKVDRYRSGAAFFLGDAAHIHSPIGGQGMNSGIGDAVNLGWKLALAIEAGADDTLLDTYHDERERIGAALLAATDYGNRMAFNANTAVRALRNAVVPLATHFALVRDRLRDNVAQVRIAYPHSRLSVNGSGHREGLRAGMRVVGTRPAGYRPQTVMLQAKHDQGSVTLVLRPDGYAGYVADGAHAHGASTYLRNVVGIPARGPD